MHNSIVSAEDTIDGSHIVKDLSKTLTPERIEIDNIGPNSSDQELTEEIFTEINLSVGYRNEAEYSDEYDSRYFHFSPWQNQGVFIAIIMWGWLLRGVGVQGKKC